MYTTRTAGRRKQAWQIGDTVKVGFVSELEVIKKIATPGDHRPDIYILWQSKTNRFYSFQPHYGLMRHSSLSEAMGAL